MTRMPEDANGAAGGVDLNFQHLCKKHHPAIRKSEVVILLSVSYSGHPPDHRQRHRSHDAAASLNYSQTYHTELPTESQVLITDRSFLDRKAHSISGPAYCESHEIASFTPLAPLETMSPGPIIPYPVITTDYTHPLLPIRQPANVGQFEVPSQGPQEALPVQATSSYPSSYQG